MIDTLHTTRRTFLQGSLSGLLLSVGFNGTVRAEDARKYGADSMPGGTVDNPHVFISIEPDGRTTLIAHRVEMGTGVRTSLPMVIADELEADWARVTVVQADANEARYGNQNVDGSRSVRHFLLPMRRAGAAARQMLEAAAAARWGVPASEVQARQHTLLHTPTGRRLGFGEVAADAARLPLPAPEQLKLKDPAQFRYIGQGKVRAVDSEAIARGQAQYGMDMRLPGMVYAVVARPPVLGGKLRSVDSAEALKVPGVLRVIELPGFTGAPMFKPLGGVAVVATNTWAAMQGRKALKITWDDGPHATYNSATYRAELEAAARRPAKVLRDQGEVMQTLAQAKPADKIAAEYYLPHLAHATMEPPVATALVKDGRCEIWTSVQNPQAALDGVAAQLGLKPEAVQVHPLLIGGGFGRKSKPDYVVEAALVAKAMPGTPVKLVWTRDDDLKHDYLHTVSVERIEAALDAKGMPQAWLHRTAAPTIASTFAVGAKGSAPFEMGMSANNMPFSIPNVSVETAEVEAHARIGWFRSVSNIPHVFASQSFIDELAHRAGMDPLAYARALIGPPRRIDPSTLSDSFNYSEDPAVYPIDTARMRAVLDAAARGARWGRRLPKGHGLGLAFCYSFLSYTATVVEVAVGDKDELRVVAMDMAIDCGPQVNPERIRSQMEGGAIMGLSLALSGEISFENGRVVQSNFHDYEVLRHAASPREIRTHLVNDNHALPAGGVGEPPLPPVAPALCNAIFAATGRRIRQLPVRTLSS